MAVSFKIDTDRLFATLVYIASRKPRGLDVYKLCKLVFLSDKLHLVRYSRPITGDTMLAMEFGPVPSHVYELLKQLLADATDEPEVLKLHDYLAVDRSFRHPRFSAKALPEFTEFLAKSDMRVLDEVIELHGNKTFDELKAMTHDMPAWRTAWNNPERSINNPEMSFEELFDEDSEAMAGACEEMNENFQLRQVFSELV